MILSRSTCTAFLDGLALTITLFGKQQRWYSKSVACAGAKGHILVFHLYLLGNRMLTEAFYGQQRRAQGVPGGVSRYGQPGLGREME